jgi:hypothetical protein
VSSLFPGHYTSPRRASDGPRRVVYSFSSDIFRDSSKAASGCVPPNFIAILVRAVISSRLSCCWPGLVSPDELPGDPGPVILEHFRLGGLLRFEHGVLIVF